MDDFVHSFETIHKAKESAALLKKTLSKGGFNLTKFVSNEQSAIQDFYDSKKKRRRLSSCTRSSLEKVCWQIIPQKKTSKFDNNGNSYSIRKILSLIACIFDPLGIIAPLIITLKIILQDVSKEGLAWDDLCRSKNGFWSKNGLTNINLHRLLKFLAA